MGIHQKDMYQINIKNIDVTIRGYVPDRLKNKEVIEYINNEIEKCDNKEDLYTDEQANIEIEN